MRRGRKEGRFSRPKSGGSSKSLRLSKNSNPSGPDAYTTRDLFDTSRVIIERVIKVHELRKHLVPGHSPSTMWLRKRLRCEPSQLGCTYWSGPSSRVRVEWA